jgi:heme-degrading monooxygenase HmoA
LRQRFWKRGINVEKVLVDLFVVPEENLQDFMDAVRTTTPFLRSLPGFVEGWIYTRENGPGHYNVITTAVWANEEAYQAAKQAAQEEYRRIDFNPQEIIARLGVQMERGEFVRAAY